jgi:nitroimidazol reductase NimA-like FMN-containing flavoprotein (pyridoxamine 5'-phosphate oxidase superfamily)
MTGAVGRKEPSASAWLRPERTPVLVEARRERAFEPERGLDSMPEPERSFAFIEAQLRKKTFGVLSTISPGGSLQTTGIIYAVSPPVAPLRLYLLTDRSFLKVRNISRNPEVSFLVPYPHHLLPFVPASCISFPGTAEIVPLEDPEGRQAFTTRRILRMNLDEVAAMDEAVFIRIRPKRSMHCYGVGIGLLTIARKPAEAAYSVAIPADRL